MSDDLSLNGTIEVSPDLEARARQLGASYTVNPLLVPGTWRVVTMSTPESRPSPGPWRWGWVDDDGDVCADDSLHDGQANAMGIYDESGRRKEPGHEIDRALIAAAPEMAAMLRELEWAGESEHWQGVRACLFCRGDEPGDKASRPEEVGHRPGCRLSSLLNRMGR